MKSEMCSIVDSLPHSSRTDGTFPGRGGWRNNKQGLENTIPRAQPAIPSSAWTWGCLSSAASCIWKCGFGHETTRIESSTRSIPTHLGLLLTAGMNETFVFPLSDVSSTPEEGTAMCTVKSRGSPFCSDNRTIQVSVFTCIV